MPGLPVNAPTEALFTIAPLPWETICRSSCFMQLHTPRKLIPITRSHSSRVLSAVGAMRAMTPALLKAASIRPNSATARSTHCSDLRVVAHVAANANRLVAARNELLRFSLHHIFPEISQYDRRTRFGERLRCRQPHA